MPCEERFGVGAGGESRSIQSPGKRHAAKRSAPRESMREQGARGKTMGSAEGQRWRIRCEARGDFEWRGSLRVRIEEAESRCGKPSISRRETRSNPGAIPSILGACESWSKPLRNLAIFFE